MWCPEVQTSPQHIPQFGKAVVIPMYPIEWPCIAITAVQWQCFASQIHVASINILLWFLYAFTSSFAIVLRLLKENYAKLYQCLPEDYVKTVAKLKQMIPRLPDNFVDQLKKLRTTKLINEAILGNVMIAIRADEDAFLFCDIMENLCNDFTSRNFIQSLRNGKVTSNIKWLDCHANVCICYLTR